MKWEEARTKIITELKNQLKTRVAQGIMYDRPTEGDYFTEMIAN